MFVVVSKEHCPVCGVKGKKWSKDPLVFTCPVCKSYFNEFGIVIESVIQEKDEDRLM